MFLIINLLVVSVILNTGAAEYKLNRTAEGYPYGFLSDCPGSSKEARITPKSLKYLKFIYYHDINVLFSFINQTAYNYHHMKALAQRMDFSKKTVLYVNGYLDSNHVFPISAAIGSQYRKLGYNVISLEYVTFTAMVYPRAVRFLRPVGKHAAEMLAELTKYGLNPKKLELIGLSHGGQAISFIAKNYRQLTGMNISRVTGLDPSGPCFRQLGPEDRIDASDADFVDIIHTNIDGYGLAGAFGHVDFYVNGGEFQPGDFVEIPCGTLCSHSRVYTIWLGSLYKLNSFIGMQCDSIQDARDRNCFDRKPFVTNLLGLNVDKSKRGIFYVMTNNIFPYAMGKKGLDRKNEVNYIEIGRYNEAGILEI